MKFEGQDKIEFAKMLAAMSVAYDKPLTEEQIRVYEIALSDCSIRDIKLAALKHLRTSRFFPRPAELRPVKSEYLLEWKRKAAESAALTRDDHKRRLQHSQTALTRTTGPTSLGELINR